MKRILFLSLSVNIVLLAVAMWRGPHPVMAPAREIRSALKPARDPASVRRPGVVTHARTVSAWSAIEDPDNRKFIEKLRAAGCPEKTIRDIITLRVCRAYRARTIELETELVLKQGTNAFLDASEWNKVNEKKQELRDHKNTELELLLGEDGAVLTASFTGFPTSSDGLNKLLTAEQRAQLREVDKRFRSELDELRTKQMTGGLEKDEVAKYRALEREKRDALAAVLSPQELEEYLYRKSGAADYVRQTQPEARNENEYRTMVKLALDLDLSPNLDSPMGRYGLGTDEGGQDNQQRKEEYARRLKELLGDERIQQQQAEEQAREDAQTKAREEADRQRMHQQLTEAATEAGVSADGATRFFERLTASETVLKKKFEEMEKNLPGTAEEKQKQMEAMVKAELDAIAKETMGDKGAIVVEKMMKRGL